MSSTAPPALPNEIDEEKMVPQELGQLIVSLQDEIKIIKLQLENLPGYEIGKSNTTVFSSNADCCFGI